MKQIDIHHQENEKIIEEDDEDGGWVDTHHLTERKITLSTKLFYPDTQLVRTNLQPVIMPVQRQP